MKRANSTDPKVYIPEIIKTNMKRGDGQHRFRAQRRIRKNPAVTPSAYKDGKHELIASGYARSHPRVAFFHFWRVGRGRTARARTAFG